METSNIKVLREALCEIVLLTIKAGKSISYDVACGIIASKAKNALKQPPRNCDLYTVSEALRKYGFPTKIKPWGEKEWLDFCEWLVSEVEGETKGE